MKLLALRAAGLIALLTGSGCSYLPESVQDFPEVLISENRDYIEIQPPVSLEAIAAVRM
jgi:hypothetical protein